MLLANKVGDDMEWDDACDDDCSPDPPVLDTGVVGVVVVGKVNNPLDIVVEAVLAVAAEATVESVIATPPPPEL